MQKTYSETFLLRTTNCDLTGRWRPGDILSVMQELAGMHAHLLGCGRDALLSKNIVWVLSRTELVMERYPVAGETIRMETFPMKNKRWFFPRYFHIFDAQEQMIGKAATLWLLMDVEDRKMASPESVVPLMPDNSDLVAPLGMPGNISIVQGEVQESDRIPVYTDIDVNQHVNNTRYADWLCDALGIEEMKKKEIEHLLIHYIHEVLPGQQMELALQFSQDSFRLTGLQGDMKHFDMGGTLRTR